MTKTDDYIDFCEGIRRLCGIDLSAYKRQQMERRIRTFAQSNGITSLTDYLQSLKADAEALDKFLDRVTINVSELFRNPEHYATLRDKVFGELKGQSRVRVWSAGCSYGAEGYTLACVAAEVLGSTNVQIVGTDIDRRVVARAQRGWFTQEDTRSVPPDILRRYFEPSNGGWQASAKIKRLCSFKTGDLLRDRFEQGWDLILCRNVVIYFTEETRDQVHRSLAAALRPGGYLMVGATERVASARECGLDTAYPFIYKRAAA